MPTPNRPTRKPTPAKKATMTRREYVADLLDVHPSDVVELPAAVGCVPVLSVDGYLYVLELPGDDRKAVDLTVARFASLERLTSEQHPGIAIYAEPPEGADGEADLALLALRALTLETEAGRFAGTKSAAITFAHERGARYMHRQDTADFDDGSALVFGALPNGTFGALIHFCPQGTAFPIFPGTKH